MSELTLSDYDRDNPIRPLYSQEARANHQPCPLCGEWHSAMSCPPRNAFQSQEIIRLSAENAKLREALEKIADGRKAYPESISPDPSSEDWNKARKILAENHLNLTNFNISNMRHIAEYDAKIAEEALK